MKQAKKTPLQCCHQFVYGPLVCMCYIKNKSRGKDHSLVGASRMPEKRLRSCQNVSGLLYGNQYRNLSFVHKTTYLWSMRSPGGGELCLSACPGVGNRPPSENKIANPRGYARGGW